MPEIDEQVQKLLAAKEAAFANQHLTEQDWIAVRQGLNDAAPQRQILAAGVALKSGGELMQRKAHDLLIRLTSINGPGDAWSQRFLSEVLLFLCTSEHPELFNDQFLSFAVRGVSNADYLARLNLVCVLGRYARQGRTEAKRALEMALQDPDERVRRNAEIELKKSV